MAILLVVDDHASNRELLVTLFGYAGHRVVEAGDGLEGLAQVKAHAPDLVICDILMPTMDGYEFVRRLRADPDLAATKVVFYTAHYHEREAARLAAAAGVGRVLIKPAEPAELLAAVAAELEQSALPLEVPPESYHREHLRLLTSKLSGTTEDLAHANARLTALIGLNLELASERDPEMLLQRVCSGARNLVGARHAVLEASDPNGKDAGFVVSSGFAASATMQLSPLAPRRGLVAQVCAEGSVLQVAPAMIGQVDLGLPPEYPPVTSAVIAAVQSPTQVLGWLCLTDKLGAEEFSASDGELLGILAAQVGRIYENGSLYRRVERYASRLESQMTRRERAERDLAAQHAVSMVLASIDDSEATTHALLETLCTHLAFAAAAIWEVDYGVDTLRRVGTWPNRDLWAATDAERAWRENRLVSHDAGTSAAAEPAALMLAFPFHLHGRVRGVIELRGGAPRVLDEQLSAACEAIGAQLAQFIERREQRRHIERLNRIHAVLSGINSLIVRVHDRHLLLAEACRIAVEHGGFGIAAIAAVEPVDGRLVTIASAGRTPEQLRELAALEHAAGPHDLGVVGRAMRRRRADYSNDVLAETGVGTPRYAVAQKLGYRSAIALPLLVDERVFGCLSLYALEAEFFTEDELRLLDELAADISFALTFIGRNEELAFLSRHDPLTGLANRGTFLERLERALKAAHIRGGKVAVLTGNLRRFRRINESFGRQAGDAVLRELAQRLRDSWPDPDNLARIGPDSFTGILTDFDNATDVAHLIEQHLSEAYARPFRIEGQVIGVGFTIGIALYPSDAADAESLAHKAEAALNDAKAAGDRYRFYAPEMTASIAESLLLETRLREALDTDQFVLHYQPKVDVVNRRVQGMEALLRWQDPVHGLVAPGSFIPVLEDTGMIVEVGFWVLCRALEDARRWRMRGTDSPRIAVNVSALQMQQPNFVDSVRQAVRAYGGGNTDAGFDLEITESIVMSDINANINKLGMLRDMGINAAIDDFGTGYSSLAYLARLPVTALKIDRSFVATMTTSPESMSIVSTTISLAHSLGLQVIAEGVELEDQARLLRLLRCDQMQGYLIGQPRALDDLGEFLH